MYVSLTVPICHRQHRYGIKATIQIYAYRMKAARAPLDLIARELQIENYYCNGDCVSYNL